MKKRALSIIIAAVMLLAILAGCGNNGAKSDTSQSSNSQSSSQPSSQPSNSSAQEAIPKLVMMFPYNDIPADIKMVEEEFNKILAEKVGCTVEIVAVTYGNILDKQTLVLSSPSEQMDLIMGMFRTGLHGNVAKGQLKPLNDLLDKYGQGIKENIDPYSLEADTINGQIYGILTNRDLATQRAFMFRKDLIEEQNIELPEVVTDLHQIAPVFEKLHKAYPDMYGLASSATKASAFQDLNGNIDFLTDYLGVLMDLNDTKVTNLFETEQYLEFCKIMTDWNKAGYIYPDILIDSSNAGSQLMRSGNLFAFIDVYKPGCEVEKKTITGYDVVAVPIGSAVRSTNQNWSWVIPENAKYPDKAMQIINLLFTDKDAINLLSYGVKDYHWTLDEQGFVVDGPHTDGYADKKNWATGNGYIAAVPYGNPADLFDRLKAFNENARKSNALGFIFDNTNYATEYTALKNVLNEQQNLIEWGFASDVEGAIRAMNDALYAAGLQKYIDAKQAQLDDWLKTKK